MAPETISSAPNERAQYLLRVLIQRFIRDGQPVGSRTLSRDAGIDLSPATIRNVMSDLEEMGLISAPHTSAGRIPTPRGYRLFVDTLIRYKPPNEGEIRKMQSQLHKQQDDPEALVSAVSNLLSNITSLTGVVTVPRGQHATLRQIEFLSLSDNRVLAILVINDCEVQNRIVHFTIRNVMSDLEEMGLISAPHTSAGRIPTPRGYRLFVDTLIRYKPPNEGEIRKMQSQLHKQQDDPEALVSAVSNLLSNITSLTGVVTVPRGQHATLRQIEFLSLSDNRVLAILVINDCEVQNRIVHTDQPYTESQLQRAANFINENYAGAGLLEIRERLLADLERTRDSMNQTNRR